MRRSLRRQLLVLLPVRPTAAGVCSKRTPTRGGDVSQVVLRGRALCSPAARRWGLSRRAAHRNPVHSFLDPFEDEAPQRGSVEACNTGENARWGRDVRCRRQPIQTRSLGLLAAAGPERRNPPAPLGDWPVHRRRKCAAVAAAGQWPGGGPGTAGGNPASTPLSTGGDEARPEATCGAAARPSPWQAARTTRAKWGVRNRAPGLRGPRWHPLRPLSDAPPFAAHLTHQIAHDAAVVAGIGAARPGESQ